MRIPLGNKPKGDLKLVEERDQRQHLREHPWLCKCRQRWKSERGLRQHMRIIRKRKWGDPSAHEFVGYQFTPEDYQRPYAVPDPAS